MSLKVLVQRSHGCRTEEEMCSPTSELSVMLERGPEDVLAWLSRVPLALKYASVASAWLNGSKNCVIASAGLVLSRIGSSAAPVPLTCSSETYVPVTILAMFCSLSCAE